MEYGAFKKIVDEYKLKKPILFGLEHDRILSEAEIVSCENAFCIKLPQKYKEFLLNYGGGFFGYTNIYSLDKESEFYLFEQNSIPIDSFLRIADNECGDYYLLRVDNHKCLDKLFFYDHEINTVFETEYEDVLEFLIKEGLKYTL